MEDDAYLQSQLIGCVDSTEILSSFWNCWDASQAYLTLSFRWTCLWGWLRWVLFSQSISFRRESYSARGGAISALIIFREDQRRKRGECAGAWHSLESAVVSRAFWFLMILICTDGTASLDFSWAGDPQFLKVIAPKCQVWSLDISDALCCWIILVDRRINVWQHEEISRTQ